MASGRYRPQCLIPQVATGHSGPARHGQRHNVGHYGGSETLQAEPGAFEPSDALGLTEVMAAQVFEYFEAYV